MNDFIKNLVGSLLATLQQARPEPKVLEVKL
jgi:hypothetical protein